MKGFCKDMYIWRQMTAKPCMISQTGYRLRTERRKDGNRKKLEGSLTGTALQTVKKFFRVAEGFGKRSVS